MSDERRLQDIAASLERGTLLVQRGAAMTQRGQAAEAHIVYREAGDLLRRALISAAGVQDDSARQAVGTTLRSVLAQWEAWGLERSGETRGATLSGFWKLPGLSGLGNAPTGASAPLSRQPLVWAGVGLALALGLGLLARRRG